MDLRVSVVLLFIFLTGGSSKVSFITKVCADKCVPGTHQIDEGTLSLHCCDTDLCNAADGVYKGSFLLLFSPLLFYFLFQ
ncbi:uncharacterized protein LOC127503778 isoform X3 [Ctenopharyngodon idella]|uniref:uncharacterized protein LOC127503778 isoform X3 n=1 Tax=Ctenopharyngodon idella TaxID=7959 RepID=UPI00222E622A|nr:uncharacterized protein LOC127503778 isoform X3 [Ctenopharyngodon idella]